MTRSRATARKAGSAFETLIVGYLADHVDERIERRTKNGSKDRGDVSSVRTFRGGRVVIECKNESGGVQLGAWMGEAEIERTNDDAVATMVAHKRHGKGGAADQWVTMSLADLAALLTGERPAEDVVA